MGINCHPRCGWFAFVRRFMADKGKSTSVLSTLNLHPGAKHPVCFAKIKSCTDLMKIGDTDQFDERHPAFVKKMDAGTDFFIIFRKKHAITKNLIIYAFTMGYLIYLFPLKSDLCRYFFQNVKKTDCGVKITNRILESWGICFEVVSLMGDSILPLIEFIFCLLHISCIFYRETGF